MRILVTGGAGYIGSHAVLALKDAGWPVGRFAVASYMPPEVVTKGTGFDIRRIEVVEVTRAVKSTRRLKGKSDPLDAYSAARTVLAAG